MAFLTRFTDWFVRTDFYIGFCSNLPQPLNNPYFDVLVIVIALVMIIMGVRDGVISYVFRMRIRKRNRGSTEEKLKQVPVKKEKKNKKKKTEYAKDSVVEGKSRKVSKTQFEARAASMPEKGNSAKSGAEEVSSDMDIDIEEAADIKGIKDIEEENATNASTNDELKDSETVDGTLIEGVGEPDSVEVSQPTVIDESDTGLINDKSGIDVEALIESIPDDAPKTESKKDGHLSEFDLLMMNLKNKQASKAKNEEMREKTAQIRERNLAVLDKKISSNIKNGEEMIADKHSSKEDIQAYVEARREEYRKEEERKARKGLFSRKEKNYDNKK